MSWEELSSFRSFEVEIGQFESVDFNFSLAFRALQCYSIFIDITRKTEGKKAFSVNSHFITTLPLFERINMTVLYIVDLYGLGKGHSIC